MEFVKLPKADFPELIQDELQLLLDLYLEVTDLDICREGKKGKDWYKNDMEHPLNAVMYSLFYEGNVYKITSKEDLLKYLPSEEKTSDPSPLKRFKDSITCPLENLAKCYGSTFLPYPGVLASTQLTDEAIIASWRLKTGV